MKINNRNTTLITCPICNKEYYKESVINFINFIKLQDALAGN